MRILFIQPDADTPPGLLEAPLRAAGAELELWEPRFDQPPAGPFDGIVLLGSETNPDEDRYEPWVGAVRGEVSLALELGIPLLGVCFGAQILAEELGGATTRMERPEIGWVDVHPVIASSDDPLLSVIPDDGVHLLGWHRYGIDLPDGVTRLAKPTLCEQAFKAHGHPAWGIQFHFEADEQIALAWIDAGVERLAAEDVDSAAIRAGIERYGARAAEVAGRIGSGFAGVVKSHSSL